MPIGLCFCFGPVIVGWLFLEYGKPKEKQDKPRR